MKHVWMLLLLTACMSAPMRSTGEAIARPMDDEYFEGGFAQGFVDVDRMPVSTFAIDVDTASYSHVRRYLEQRRLPPMGAVRIEEMINAFDYDDPRPRDESVALHVDVGAAPWTPLHRLVRFLSSICPGSRGCLV